VGSGGLAKPGTTSLACAYYAANEAEGPYDRRRHSRAYERRAFALYREPHVRQIVAMAFKAVGLSPRGRLAHTASRLAWNAMRYRVSRLNEGAGLALSLRSLRASAACIWKDCSRRASGVGAQLV